MSMIHEITSATPRLKRSQRKGRGESSGRGKTSGKGHKGAKARVGKYIKRGHEGGQTPIFRRFPKRGFSNFDFESRFHIINLADLNRFEEGTTVDAVVLMEAGLVRDRKHPVKVLGNGNIEKKLNVQAKWFSRSAHEKISQAGGAAQDEKGQPFVFPREKPRRVDPKVLKAGPGTKSEKAKSRDKAAEAEAPAKAQEPEAPAAAPADSEE
jgi:large subunit ribosomal protein L15